MRLKTLLNFAILASAFWVMIIPPVSALDDTDTSGFFVTFPAVTASRFNSFVLAHDMQPQQIAAFCERIKQNYEQYRWKADQEGCGINVPWKANLKSHGGSPLLWSEFGTGENTTLILGGVHPDELTPIPLAFKFASHLSHNKELVPPNSRVIVAPLINPDGFFKATASRTNTNGVDLNRNFFTHDWYTHAKHWWALKRQNNLRHFPGHIPNSEIETLYQIWLIDTFKPDKIISIHSPLGFYDYDGPGERKEKDLTESERKAKKLVQSMSSSSKNYKIVDYSFYPGSLGNYAGNERGIPTITLELETTDPKKTDQYWNQFSPGLEQAVKFPFSNPTAIKSRGASLFLEGYKSQDERMKSTKKI